jgi:hypothetical protein
MVIRGRETIVALGIILSGTVAQAASAQFDGFVEVRWIDGGANRDMQLTKAFSFVDQSGKTWTTPSGSVVNGASIPQVLWSLHDPYIGPYRRASVIHDFYCTPPYSEPDMKVHRMYYDAALAGGTDEVTAYAMWKVIEAGGPHWKNVEVRIATAPQSELAAEDTPTQVLRTEQRLWMPDTSEDELKELYMRARNPQADRTAIEADVARLAGRNQPPSRVTLPFGANEK